MYRLLLAAKNIPLDCCVTKRNGDKQYIIRDRICIFDQDGNKQEIKSNGDTRFLIADNGNANVIDGDTELLWSVDDINLIEYLENCDE